MAATFSHDVTDGNTTVTVNFTLHPIRSSNFKVLVQDDQGNFNQHTPAAASTYLGQIGGMPGALASGLVRADGKVLCRISFESGVEWSSTGAGPAISRGNTNWKPNPPINSIVGSGGAGSQVFAAEVGVDATNAHYIASGGSVAATLEMVEFSVMAANVAYLRDAAILHELGRVVVRTSAARDPYVPDGDSTNDLLIRVQEQWNNVLPVGYTHQLALVVKPGAYGGLAYVGVIGTSISYSANGADANGDFSVIWRHEAGHNWSSDHYEGGREGHVPEGPTIMSGNELSRFSSSELVKIIAHRKVKTGILRNLGPYSFALPPRANMDHATFTMDTPTTINVLANDSDSNGRLLNLSYFSSSSALGGKLMYSNSQIIYTPPTAMASGVDYFSYQIVDAVGNTATGYVTLRPTLDDDLVSHWPLHEGSGTIAYDTTSSQNDGTLTSGVTWTTRDNIGAAISLDGTNGQVIASNLNLNTNSMTITGWVRCNGSQHEWAGLAMCRDTSGIVAGLNLGVSNELHYHWESGNNPSYHFNSGLILRDTIWTFVALVISPTQATIYMMEEGMTLNAAIAQGIFNPQDFRGHTFCLGNDPGAVSIRMFKGDMSEFRVFQRALTRAEITSLARDGGTPSSARALVLGRSFDFASTPTIVEEPMICGTCAMHNTQE